MPFRGYSMTKYCVDTVNQNGYFRSFIYSQSSTIPANFLKIGRVDVEIIGLSEIVFRFILKSVIPMSRHRC